MEKNVFIILSMTITAIAVTFLATNGMLPVTTLAIAQDPALQSEDSKVLGHVTYVIRGPDGHIKEYMQTDNIRTTQGLNCAAAYLFANSTLGSSCQTSASALGFKWIYLINNTFSTSASHTFSSFSTGAAACAAPCLMDFATGTVQGQPSAAGTVTFPATGEAVITSPTFSFSGLESATSPATTVTGSALFNEPSSVSSTKIDEFAENTMSVGVGSADTLTVTWSITLS